MVKIINKIKIEKFYYFEKKREYGLGLEMIDYYVVFTFRINDESKLNIERSFTGFNSVSDEICSKLLRAVLSYKVYERSKNNYMKLTYEATSQDEFKKLHNLLEDNEDNRKGYERILKDYIYSRHYDKERNKWHRIFLNKKKLYII